MISAGEETLTITINNPVGMKILQSWSNLPQNLDSFSQGLLKESYLLVFIAPLPYLLIPPMKLHLLLVERGILGVSALLPIITLVFVVMGLGVRESMRYHGWDIEILYSL
jgi:hypothetical protein